MFIGVMTGIEPNVMVRPAHIDDAIFLYELRTDPLSTTMFLQPPPESFTELEQ